MREQVTIVLNEREPTKAGIASALEEQLLARGISASRITSGLDRLERTLATRASQVIVLDYVLGDHTSGIEILKFLSGRASFERPQIIFLTDEPSVGVVVSAMKNGAYDYIEIDAPHALQRAVAAIEKALGQSRTVAPLPLTRLSLHEIIGVAPVSLALHNHLVTHAKRQTRLVVVSGPKGSGRSTLARALAEELHRQSACFVEEHDLRCSTLRAEALLNRPQKLSTPFVLLLDHLDQDDGSIIAAYQRLSSAHRPEHLIGISADPLIALAWQRQLDAAIVNAPALRQREDDIAPLAQRFIQKALDYCRAKLSVRPVIPSASAITRLRSHPWEGNIAQLHSAVIDAVIQSSTRDESFENVIAQHLANAHTFVEEMPVLSPLVAALTLERFDYNRRLAAAVLGCSLQQLSQVLACAPVPGDVHARLPPLGREERP